MMADRQSVLQCSFSSSTRSSDWLDPAAVLLDEQATTGKAAPEPRPAETTDMHWAPPPRGTVKLNTDTAFASEMGVGAAGAVARDHRGHVVISACRKLPPSDSVEEAEARAALIGLQELAGVYSDQVVLEMDNQMIVKEVESQCPTRSPCYGLIMDIKHAMGAFSACKIGYVKRCNNALADGLAALNRSDGDQVLTADVPDSLRTLTLSECNRPSQ